ncbi:DUF421 domain-containing protein [Paenibacillus sp. YYML68]|uniref:DUF421 domain-containing protein n=1 Tax=Paenibacillus sp. YYML68 TaxID=2909250 RepID=UPI002491FC4D|nr:DUF421 domain-containing protein [Paenibacillus sp. YYML68]
MESVLELFKDFAVVFGRIITIFPLMLLITLFMGRRSIGELPVFDFLVVLALGAVVGADIADPNIEHLPTAFAIAVIAVIQKIFSIWVIKSRWFGKLVTFEPIIVVYQGKLLKRNLKKSKYSIDNIVGMLREAQAFDIRDVQLAVIEANGSISVMKKSFTSDSVSVSYPIIKEGRIDRHIMTNLHLKEPWLLEQLSQRQIRLEDVFIATINHKRELEITMDNEGLPLPPLHH